MNLCLGCMKKLSENDVCCPFCGHTVGMTAENALREGTILENRYIVGKMLSENTLQTTYLGWDAAEERKVVIKEFFPRIFAARGNTGEMVVQREYQTAYDSALKAFMSEYNIQQRFQGLGCIADIKAVIQANNTLYGVVEFIEGTTLAETLKNHTVTFDSAKAVIVNLAKTLAPLHKAGVTHCNICPNNIMIMTDGSVKLLDFGAANYKLGLGRGALVDVLKEGYAPAELSSAKSAISAQADVYSLAAVLYKMLTGITPPPATERMENDTLRAPSAVAKIDINAGAENAILNALSVYPDQRTESVDAFLYELADPGTQHIKTAKKDRNGGKVPLWLKILAPVLAVLIFTVFFVVGKMNSTLSLGTFFSKENLVPNVLNISEEEAKQTLRRYSLYMTIKETKHTDSIEAGRVLAQTPQSGTLLPKHSTVEVVMSAGKDETPKKGIMPYVQYQKEEDARKILKDLGIKVNVEYAQSETVEKGLVISQSIEKDTELKEDTSVTITVSTGIPPRATPKPVKTPKPTKAPTPTPTPTQTPADLTPSAENITLETTTPTPTPTPTQTPADLTPGAGINNDAGNNDDENNNAGNDNAGNNDEKIGSYTDGTKIFEP